MGKLIPKTIEDFDMMSRIDLNKMAYIDLITVPQLFYIEDSYI